MENQKPRYELDPNMGVPGQVLLRLFGFTVEPIVIKTEHLGKDAGPLRRADPVSSLWNKASLDKIKTFHAMIEQDIAETVAEIAKVKKKRLSGEKKTLAVEAEIKNLVCNIIAGASVSSSISYANYAVASGDIEVMGLMFHEYGLAFASYQSKAASRQLVEFQPSLHSAVVAKPFSEFLTEDGTVDQIKLNNRLKQLSIEAGSFPDDYVATNYQKEEK